MSKIHWRKIQSLLLSPWAEDRNQEGRFPRCFQAFQYWNFQGIMFMLSWMQGSLYSVNGNHHWCLNKSLTIDILGNKTTTGSIQYLDQHHSPSSTTSPTKTLEIPDIAITTFWDTEVPVMDWISLKEGQKTVIKVVKDWLWNIVPIRALHWKSSLKAGSEIDTSKTKGFRCIMAYCICWDPIPRIQNYNWSDYWGACYFYFPA